MEYRLPGIEEFIDGFCFEVYSEGYFEDSIEDFCGWYPYQMGTTNWRDMEEIQELIESNNIRTAL